MIFSRAGEKFEAAAVKIAVAFYLLFWVFSFWLVYKLFSVI